MTKSAYDKVRIKVLTKIFGEKQIKKTQNAQIDYSASNGIKIRARVTKGDDKGNFLFDIDPSYKNVDFTVFICNNVSSYYLFPKHFIEDFYNNVIGEMSKKHPDRKPATISNTNHTLRPSGVKKDTIDIRKYYNNVYNQKYGNHDEGLEHKQLKEWIAQNPGYIGLRDVIGEPEIDNHSFPSGDRPDIIFHCEGYNYYCVEIETDNPYPGAYQAVKYKALLKAELIEKEIKKFDVHSILVAWSIQDETRHFCDLNDIKYYEKKLT